MSIALPPRVEELNALGQKAAQKAWATYVIVLGPTGMSASDPFSFGPSEAQRLLANRRAQATWTSTLAEAGAENLLAVVTQRMRPEAFMAMLAAGAAGLLGAFVLAPRDLVGAASALGVNDLDVSFAIYEDERRNVHVRIGTRVALLPDAFAHGSLWRQEFSRPLGPVGSLGGSIEVTLDEFSFGADFDHDAGLGAWKAELTFKWSF